MAHIQRLTYWLLVATVFVLSSLTIEAHAAAPIVKYKTFNDYEATKYFDDYPPVCDAYARGAASHTGQTFVAITSCVLNIDTVQASYTAKSNTDGVTRTFGTVNAGKKIYVCYESPTIERTATYVCQSSPPPDCSLTAGEIIGPATVHVGDNVPNPVCIQSCQYAIHDKTAPFLDCGDDGVMLCKYDVSYTYIGVGASCTPEVPLPAPLPAKPPCPACDCAQNGGSYGTINGVETCLPRGTPGTDPIKTELPPTIKTNTPAPTPENPNPAPVETVTPGPIITLRPPPAGAPAGSPTQVDQTVTNSDGSTTTVSTTYGEFCEQNPNNAVCKPGGGGNGGPEQQSTFGGSCGAFTCTGDAVQCAIAKKQYQDRCDDIAGVQQYAPAIETGQKLLNGEYDDDVQNFINRGEGTTRTVDLTTDLSETGNASFGATGLTDVTTTVLGHTVVLPLSKLNQFLEIMGYILLAMAYLSSLRIVGLT